MRYAIPVLVAYGDRGAAALVCGVNEVARERTALDAAVTVGRRVAPEGTLGWFPIPEEGHVRADARCRRPSALTSYPAGIPRRAGAAEQADALSGGSTDDRGDRHRDAPRRRRCPRPPAAGPDRRVVARRSADCEAIAEADLDPRRGSLLVRRGKGGRRREVNMDDWAWEQLEPWLQARVELPVGPVFCIVNGPTRGRPWTAGAARTELRRVAREAGVRRRFAPHQVRHAHAVEMAREGVPLIVIQRQLGHTNLGITSIYLQGIDNTRSSTPSTPAAHRWSPSIARSRTDAATGGGEARGFLAAGARQSRRPRTGWRTTSRLLHSSPSSDALGGGGLRRRREGAVTLRVAGLLLAGGSKSGVTT
jgi:integrase-like protein